MNPQPDIVEDDDEYRESEDEDYDPGASPANDSDDGDDDNDKELDSEYAKYQGSGGLIKTRAQRRAEAREGVANQEKNFVSNETKQSSIDVDALWKEMNGTPSSSRSSSTVPETASKSEQKPAKSEKYITITRVFKFAGETRSETKEVLESSAEGQDYLRQQKQLQEEKHQAKKSSNGSSEEQQTNNAEPASIEKRPRSTGRGPVKRKMSLMEEYQMNKAKKVNTLEKSRLDWLGFVDKEGIKDDLTRHNKGGYLDRQSFLSRVDQKVDQSIREQRSKRT